jgi:hypothetical protein
VHFDIILLERQRQKIGSYRLLEPEIRGFQDALAGFILGEVCSKTRIFSLLWARTKEKKAHAKAANDR